MADDNILEIGAVIDLDQVLPGLQTLVNDTKASVAEMKATMATAGTDVNVINPETLQQAKAALAEAGANIEILAAKEKELKQEVEEYREVLASATAAEDVEIELANSAANAKVALVQVSQQLKTARLEEAAAIQALNVINDKNITQAEFIRSLDAEREAALMARIEAIGNALQATLEGTVADEKSATATGAAGAAQVRAAGQTNLSTLAIRDQMVAIQAQTGSWEQAAQQMIDAGASIQGVTNALLLLNVPLREIAPALTGASQGIRDLAAQLTGGTIGLGGFARGLQLLGLSGKEISEIMSQLGVSTDTILAVFNRLGISLSMARNEMLATRAAAGATREELDTLAASFEKLTQAARNYSVAQGEARVGFGLLEGSTGMVAGGLARVTASSKLMSSVLEKAFPAIIALGFIDILTQAAEHVQKIGESFMGITDEIKKATEEEQKFNEHVLTHSDTMQEALRKISEANRTITNDVNTGWLESMKKGAEAADQTTSAWERAIPIFGSGIELYRQLAGGLDELANKTHRLEEARKEAEAGMKDSSRLSAENLSFQVKELDAETAYQKVAKDRAAQLQIEINMLHAKLPLVEQEARARVAGQGGSAAAGEIAARQAAEELNAKITTNQAERDKALAELSIANRLAVANAEKTVDLARLAEQEKFIVDSFELGKIGLQEELSQKISVENQKRDLDKATLEAKRASLVAEQALGKDTGPQITEVDAQLKANEIARQADILQIRTEGALQQRKLDEERALASIQASQLETNARLTAEKEMYKDLYAEGQVNEATYTALIKANLQDRTAAAIQELQKRRDAELAGANLEQRAAIETRYQGEIKAAKIKGDAEIEAEDVEHHRRMNEEAKKAFDLELKQIEDRAKLSIDQDKFQTDEHIRSLNVRRQIGQLTTNQEIADAARETVAEDNRRVSILQTALAEAQAAASILKDHDKEEAALKRIEGLQQQLARAVIQRNNDITKSDDDMFNNEQIQAQKTFSVVSQSFNSAFDRMITEHVRFSSIMTQFWNQMVAGWAKMGLQILANYVQTMAEILARTILNQLGIQTAIANGVTLRKAAEGAWEAFKTALGVKEVANAGANQTAITAAQTAGLAKEKVAQTTADTTQLTTQTALTAQIITLKESEATGAITAAAQEHAALALINVADVTSSAAVGAAAAAAAAAPLGPEASAAAASVEEALILAFAPQAGAAERGALLDKDMLISAHAKEMILPPHISTGLQGAISSGSFGGAPGATTNNNNRQVHMPVTVHYHQEGGGGLDPDQLHSAVVSSVKRAVRNGALDLR